MSLRELQAKLQKASKGTHVSILSESDIAASNVWIPTPSYDFNRILSGSLFKGIPSKMFTVLVGPEASFKSSFMALCLANAQREGFTPVVVDTEGSWTVDFVRRWGLDPENMLYVYTPWVDEIMVILGQLISDDMNRMALAVDSIGGLETIKLLDDAEKGDVKSDQGTLQRKIKRLLKMIVNICKSKDSVGYAAAHYYGNPSGYGDPQQVGGGFYLKLAPDIIVSLKKTKIYDKPKGEDRKVIGTEITAIALKNRIYPPFNEAIVEIDYVNGINPYAGLLPIAIDAGIITQGGAWYTHTASGTKVQGGDKVIQIFVDHPEILTELDEWVKKSGYSTINQEVKIKEEMETSDKPNKNVEFPSYDVVNDGVDIEKRNGKRRKKDGTE